MFEDRQKRTELSELGEFGLIKHLTATIELKNESSLKGVGDDAAVLDYSGMLTLLSTDILIEGVNFDLSYYPLKHLGYKAAIVNFSDIAAMGAKPEQITVSMALSNRFSLEAIEEIYSGIRLACEKYKVDIIGGDTTSSTSGLVISISVMGKARKEDIVYRNTARENDLICVSGDLGSAYAGLLILEREKREFTANPNMQPDLRGYDYALQRQLKPEARVEIPEILRKNDIKATSMIDVSDGLASEVLHIATSSELGCTVYEDKIPIDLLTNTIAEDFKMDPSILALNGGEDYELLFTVDVNDHEKITKIPEISIIGHMTDKASGMNLISRSGTSHPLNAQGWDAFLHKDTENTNLEK